MCCRELYHIWYLARYNDRSVIWVMGKMPLGAAEVFRYQLVDCLCTWIILHASLQHLKHSIACELPMQHCIATLRRNILVIHTQQAFCFALLPCMRVSLHCSTLMSPDLREVHIGDMPCCIPPAWSGPPRIAMVRSAKDSHDVLQRAFYTSVVL